MLRGPPKHIVNGITRALKSGLFMKRTIGNYCFDCPDVPPRKSGAPCLPSPLKLYPSFALGLHAFKKLQCFILISIICFVLRLLFVLIAAL